MRIKLEMIMYEFEPAEAQHHRLRDTVGAYVLKIRFEDSVEPRTNLHVAFPHNLVSPVSIATRKLCQQCSRTLTICSRDATGKVFNSMRYFVKEEVKITACYV